MKKFILLISIIYIGSLTLFAQNISLLTSSGVVNNGDTITYTSTDPHASLVSYMWVKNNSTQAIPVRVKKIELDTVPGSENYFCWAQCYLPQTYIGDTLGIAAGFTNKSNFSGDYDANGNAGKTRIMYVFYNDNDHNDSIAFVAEYYAGSSVGIAMNKPVSAEARVYPNPAKNAITVEYQLSKLTDNVKFEVRNILGSVVKDIKLNALSGQRKIDISGLQNGVYFYTIRIDDKVVISNKLIIQQ